MNDPVETTPPSPQAVVAWKKKADRLVGLVAAISVAEEDLAARLRPIREKFEPGIADLKKEAAKLREEFEDFGIEHANHLFSDGSEIATKVAVITGKDCPPSVTLDEDLDDGDVVAVLEADKALKKFVAVKKSLDRNAIKAALKDKAGKFADRLHAAGVSLVVGFSVKVRAKES